MTSERLASLLRESVKAHGSAYPAVHLFGIEFAEALGGHNLREIAEGAGLSANYGTEISKGRKLAQYVQLKR